MSKVARQSGLGGLRGDQSRLLCHGAQNSLGYHGNPYKKKNTSVKPSSRLCIWFGHKLNTQRPRTIE